MTERAYPHSAALELIDGLTSRGLIDRVQIVQCDGVSVQLGPKPFTPPALTDEQEAKRDERKAAPLPDPNVLLYAGSEGM